MAFEMLGDCVGPFPRSGNKQIALIVAESPRKQIGCTYRHLVGVLDVELMEMFLVGERFDDGFFSFAQLQQLNKP